MRKHTFTTRRQAGATPVEVTVMLPSYDEATEKQRRSVYDDGLFGQGTTVPVQTRLRHLKAEDWKSASNLQAKAQVFFDDRLNNTRTETQVVIDAAALKLTKAQCEGLRASGATILNEPAK